MAKVLAVENLEEFKTSLPPYPALKNLKQHIPDTKIKLFEFYDLKQCQLYTLIAERNTSLGKLQLPSRRYLYERKLIKPIKKPVIFITGFFTHFITVSLNQ